MGGSSCSCGDALASTCGDDGTQTLLLLLLLAYAARGCIAVGALLGYCDGDDEGEAAGKPDGMYS